MKFIVIGLILAIAIAAMSFTGGYIFAKQDTANRIILQTEHNAINEKLDDIADKCDDIDEKCDGIVRIEQILKNEIRKSAYMNDR